MDHTRMGMINVYGPRQNTPDHSSLVFRFQAESRHRSVILRRSAGWRIKFLGTDVDAAGDAGGLGMGSKRDL